MTNPAPALLVMVSVSPRPKPWTPRSIHSPPPERMSMESVVGAPSEVKVTGTLEARLGYEVYRSERRE